MLSARVLGSTLSTGSPLWKAVVIGAAPSACTPRKRGMRSISPRLCSSAKAFQAPAMEQPSPTDMTTQSGTSQASCSAISKPTVFLPSIR